MSADGLSRPGDRRWVRVEDGGVGGAVRERGCRFECEGSGMMGVLALPARPSRIGVVIVVGGPQYRIGSHRQFVSLSRAVATAAFPCLRFDHRGIGDSDGPRLGFERIGSDIRAAIDTICRAIPDLEGVVLVGLCDGASASALYAPNDRRVAGLALFNPWVRTSAGEAEAMVRHYYVRRLMNGHFWAKLAGGRVDIRRAIAEFLRTVRRAFGTSARMEPPMHDESPLPARIGDALLQYRGPLLIALSGNDRVAEEFRLAAARPGSLAERLNASSVRIIEMPDADHTFSLRGNSDDVTRGTIEWLLERFAVSGEEPTERVPHTEDWG